MTDIEIPSPGGTPGLRGVLEVPSGTGPWPGAVVVHEAFGVDAVMRRQVTRLAAAGYVTLMPDLYTTGGIRCVAGVFRALLSGAGPAFADVSAARRLLASRPDCTGKIGVIGFCMGGSFALLTAGEFDAAAANYPRLPGDLDVLEGSCPIIASFGAKDRTLRGAAAKLETALTRLNVVHDVTEYPAAGHSFLNDAPAGPRLTRPLQRIAGIRPDPETATEAWHRIDAFLAQHLH